MTRLWVFATIGAFLLGVAAGMLSLAILVVLGERWGTWPR